MAAGATVPLSERLGDSWSLGLGFWLIPALLAALIWLPQARQGHGAHNVAYRVRGLLRDPLAWQVTLYMACNRRWPISFSAGCRRSSSVAA
ncbi:MFS transporter, CP family, cyanate transporter [Pseudomonas sp. UC 17F4]|nr:MFS transporter, CP family, cyanate transporter [Pseudomonas sp. UC 17F4]